MVSTEAPIDDKPLRELISGLHLQKTAEYSYFGQSQDLGYPRVFGGQVLGQALLAAQDTVQGRYVHSLHAYFLRPGKKTEGISYEVDPIRDGTSFSTRRVVARQGGFPIFNMSISFQKSEDGFEHQKDMPGNVPRPEHLISELERARKYAQFIPEAVRGKVVSNKPLDLRPVTPINYFQPEVRQPEHMIWLKAMGDPGDNQLIQQSLLAYASDFGLIETALLPHGLSIAQKQVQVASLDHSMWFHQAVDLRDWLLYHIASPRASQARGLSIGHFYNRKGQLVATACQEGLMRPQAAN